MRKIEADIQIFFVHKRHDFVISEGERWVQGTYYTDWLSLLANLYKYSFIHLNTNLMRTYYFERYYDKE